MRRFFTSPLIALVLLAIPLILVAFLYPGLPETIPVHFNAGGIADKYGSKSSIWIHNSILFAVGISVYLLISNLHKIDPKKTAGVSADTHRALAFVLVLFLSVINTSITLSMSGVFKHFGVEKVVLPATGILIAVMGYFMRNIKPNYFIGLRLPWTLEDENNWAATHRLAAKLWIPAGLIMAFTAIVFPFMTAFIITIAVTMIIVLIPAIYSYRFFKQRKT